MNDDDKPRRDGRPEGDKRPMRSYGMKSHGGRSGGAKDDPARGGRDGKPAGGARGYKDAPGGSSVRVQGRSSERAMPAPEATRPEREERIAKRLARAGVASRREAETMIAAGRVSVNGRKLDSPALNVRLSDRIEIDGQPLPDVERTRLWLYHKPTGLVCSNRDPEGRTTIFEKLPKDLPRVMSVGRLDINTEGLLLLTNDGGLARLLELPKTGWLRRYRVRAHGKITQERLDELKNGMAVDGVFYGAMEATIEREQGANVWIEMALREGKNREIKNVLGALGLDVTRLIRTSFGPFQLGDLPEGHVMEVRGKVLRDQLGDALIEEAGANFDAPVLNPFPNRPVSHRDEETARVTVEKRGDWVSGTRGDDRGPRFKPDRRDKGDKRDDALGRLSTKRPDRGDDKAGPGFKGPGGKGSAAPGGRGGRGGQEDSRPPARSRSSNVWMAPGARPTTRKKPAEEPQAAPAERGGGPARQNRDPAREKGQRPDRAGRPADGDRAARTGKPSGAGKPAGAGKPSYGGKASYAGKSSHGGKPSHSGKPSGGGKTAGSARPSRPAGPDRPRGPGGRKP